MLAAITDGASAFIFFTVMMIGIFITLLVTISR
jgi:hypothetical protein